MQDQSVYHTIKIKRETHRKLRILAATNGESMLDLIDRLIDENNNQQETVKMSDHQTYKTRKDAKTEIEMMRGWDAKPVKLVLPDDPNADKDGNAWVIQCDGDKYMRTDGYVR